MRIEQIMTRNVTTCTPQDTLDQAAGLMWNADCGCLPVTEGGDSREVIGVITDRDICMAAFFQGKALRDLRVDEAMARSVLTCRASDNVEAVQRKMQNEQIRRLPVVGNEGELIGIVSMADIVIESARTQNSQHPAIAASTVTTTLAGISARNGDRPAT